MNSTRRSILSGLSTAALVAGTADAQLLFDPSGTGALRPLSPSKGGVATVIRGGGYGTNAHNNKDATNAAQWSALSRDAYYFPYAVKAGQVLEVAVPLWTMERPSGVVTETDLPEAYDFALNFEYPYKASATSADTASVSRALTADSGAVVYSYTPGQAAKKAVFRVTAPSDIPAMAAFGLHLIQECVAGRSGGVTNKLILRADGSSNFLGRFGSKMTTTSSLIASNNTAPPLTFSADVSAQTGNTKPMSVGGIRTLVPVNTPSILVDGNSIEQGSNEGTDVSSTYGDTAGDAYRNRGWATRLAAKLGLTVSQMSRGSDKDSDRLVAGNYARRMDFAAWLSPTHYIDMNSHNDGSSTVNWTASTSVGLDATVISSANGYICSQAGTTGATGPTGTGADIPDGTAKWTYIGPNDMSGAGIGWVGARRKRLRLVQAALPSVKFIGTTCTPDTASTRTASSYIYDSTSGNLTITLADASDLVVGGRVRVAGLTPSGLNSSGIVNVLITAISGNTITVVRPTGLTAPTGTLVLNTTWSSTAGQTPKSGFGAGNSQRSWINRFSALSRTRCFPTRPSRTSDASPRRACPRLRPRRPEGGRLSWTGGSLRARTTPRTGRI